MLVALAVLAVCLAGGAAYARARSFDKKVLLVGDSLVTQAKPLLDESFKADDDDLVPLVYPGTDMAWAAEQLRAGMQQKPDVVVLGTGTNNSTFGWDDNDAKAMNDLLALSDGVDCVVWVMPSRVQFPAGVPVPSEFGATLIDQVVAAAALHPHVHVARWDQVAQSHAEWYQFDGLHYNDVGNAAFASFITDSTEQACG